MSRQELVVAYEADPGWVEVPDGPGTDTRAWAREVLQAWQGDGTDRGHAPTSAVADALARCADTARDPARPADVAWVYLADAGAAPLAVCSLDLLEVVPGQVPGLDELEGALTEPQPEHLDRPVVTRRLLPAGWAVRQRVLRTDGASSQDVQESVTWSVLLPDVDDALLRLTTTWRAVLFGDLLAAQADRLAAGVSVVIPRAS